MDKSNLIKEIPDIFNPNRFFFQNLTYNQKTLLDYPNAQSNRIERKKFERQQVFLHRKLQCILQMEPLKDPKCDRVVKTVPLPPHRPLSSELLFGGKPPVNWELLRDHLKKEGRVNIEDVFKMLDMCSEILKNQPNLLSVQDPVTIVGDIHGQYYDFLKVLDIGGNPATNRYLFLGDYVDRGVFSTEVLLLVLALKINFPENVLLLRGNHECRQMTSYFNFRSECLYKYNQLLYERVMETFDKLPLACILNGKFFCVHGGISPDLVTLQDVTKINRFQQIPKKGILCDLMWSDPVDNNDGHSESPFKYNDVRGCSYFFGYSPVKTFLEKTKCLSVIRAHEAQAEGFKMYRWNGSGYFPVVITIFSAPNYCDVYKNKAAVIKFKNNQLDIQQFNNEVHPYLLPNFLDVFKWSIPFVSQKITQMLYHIIKPSGAKATEIPVFDNSEALTFVQALLDMQKEEVKKNMDLAQSEGDSKLIEKGFKREQGKGEKDSEVFNRTKTIDRDIEKRPEL